MRLSIVAICSFLVAFTYPMLGSYKLTKSIDTKARFLTTDFLKNVYTITEKNQLMKYDSTGNTVGVYSEKKYGSLTSVDATSPFNILAFYKEFATIVSLDMRMNPKRLYKLPSIDINNVSAVCLSEDNYIWFYDMDDGRLKKMDNNYEIVHESIELPQLLGEAIEPNFLIERQQGLYMNVPGMGIIIFDIFANYYTSIPNVNLGNDSLNSFQLVNGQVVYFDEGKLFLYDISTASLNSIAIPNTNANTKAVSVEKGHLYVLNNAALNFYVEQ